MGGRIFHVVFAVVSLLLHGVKGDVCEQTWILYEDVCFKYFDEGIVQVESNEQCSSRGARLLTALTPRLKDFLVLHMGDNKNLSYWCNTHSGRTDPSLVPSTSAPSLRPMITSPKSVSSTENTERTCYYLQDKALYKGDCNVPRGFICEKDSIIPPATCPEGTDKVGTNCFWITTNLLNKPKAAETCSQQAGWLANLDTRRKRTYAISTVALKKKVLWVDARKHQGKIKWGNGDIFDPDQEAKYMQIKDEGGDCVVLGVSDVSELGTSWIFEGCDKTAYGLCEKEGVLTPMTKHTTTSLPETTRAPKCPGISYHEKEKDGICYWETSYETPSLTWDKAREYCQSYGGDLASYKDAEEEEFALGSAKGNSRGFWIGIRRAPGSNVYRWTDGSPLIYTNWAPGQPKFRGNSILCVAHTGQNSTWEVTNCGVKRWMVCKIPKAAIPSSPIIPTSQPATECTRYKSSPLIHWTYHQGYCYAFYPWRELSWYAAKSFCQDNGAYLASLHSLEETNFLLLQVPNAFNKDLDFWLGLSAKGLHSSYRWEDGSPFDFVNWDEDDTYDDMSNTETCVSFDQKNGFMKKNHCNKLQYAICMAPNGTNPTFTTPAPTSTLPGFCPDEWFTFGNKCYRVFGIRDRNTWPEANKKCAKMGSQLVSIHSQEENDFLTLLVLFAQWGAWIGMYSTIGGRLFHWTDNSTMDYTNWDLYEPSYAEEKEECVHMVYNEKESKLGKWNDHVCSAMRPFFCEMPKDPMLTKPGRDAFLCSQRKGWIKLGQSCYQIFNDSDNRLTWLQAQSHCISVNSSLASIRNFAVSVHLRHHLTGSTGWLWIGMTDTIAHTYMWLGPSSTSTYTNWLNGQPKQVSPMHNCVAINAEAKWMVRNCDESHPFLCEETKVPPTVAPDESDFVCPNSTKDWIEVGGKFCYIIEIKQEVEWFTAAHRCFKLGGYLASFHSKYETEAILHLIKESNMPVHIGLGQKEDGTFGWFDGSAVDYVNWAPAEPNSVGEMCVEMHSDTGTWNDVNCEAKRGYVCSTKKVPRNLSKTDTLTDKRNDLESRINAGGIAGIIICILVVLCIVGVGLYYFFPSTRMRVRQQVESSPL